MNDDGDGRVTIIQRARNISVIMDLQVSSRPRRQPADRPSQPLYRQLELAGSEKLNVPSLESISSFSLGHIGRIVEFGDSFITPSLSKLDSGCRADLSVW